MSTRYVYVKISKSDIYKNPRLRRDWWKLVKQLTNEILNVLLLY